MKTYLKEQRGRMRFGNDNVELVIDRWRAQLATLTSQRDPGAIEARFAEYLGEIENLAALADGAGTAVR